MQRRGLLIVVGFLSALFFVMTVMSGVAGAVPVQWTVASGGNGHWYEVTITPSSTWESARDDSLAIGAGWDLVSITSQAEQDFIISLLPASPNNRDELWIGGHDVDPGESRSWEWSNGDSFLYTNWWDEEPNGPASHAFVSMDFREAGTFGLEADGWAWNNLPSVVALTTKGYVSEQSFLLPEPSTALLLTLGFIGMCSVNRRTHLR